MIHLLVGEDYDMMRSFVKHGLKICHVRNALYLCRKTENSLSREYSAQKAQSHFEVIRRLHAKCLTAATYLAKGQAHIKTNSSLFFTKIAFGQAWADLNDCLKIDPNNQQIQELLQKCELGRKRYEQQVQQVVC